MIQQNKNSYEDDTILQRISLMCLLLLMAPFMLVFYLLHKFQDIRNMIWGD